MNPLAHARQRARDNPRAVQNALLILVLICMWGIIIADGLFETLWSFGMVLFASIFVWMTRRR